MKLADLLEGEKFRINDPALLHQEVDHWTNYSLEVQPGSWFVAARGETFDGHDYIPEALERGAQGLIVERELNGTYARVPQVLVTDARHIVSLFSSRWFGDPSQALHLIGVTGTNGKTTTTFLIQHVLNAFSPCGLIGTIEASWKEKRAPVANTTPAPRELNRLLAQMIQEGVASCAMEVSSHALKQGRVREIQFRTAVFTNLSQDHLDYHKTFDDYFGSKKKLFLEFPSVSRRIINTDDAYGKKLWDEIPRNTAVSFSTRSEADYRAARIRLGLDGTDFALAVKGKEYEVKSKLLCLHNVYNLLASIAVTHEMGFPMDKILEALASFDGVPGRLERIAHPRRAVVFVDYAHTPDAFVNIFSSLGTLKRNRLISVFGCGGNRDQTKRPQMGRLAAEFSDHIILTSDNPRNEDPAAILQDIQKGIDATKATKQPASLTVMEDRREAIHKALEMAQPEDLVLILGKGHEDYQIIGKEKRKFSDKKEIEAWVQSHKAHTR